MPAPPSFEPPPLRRGLMNGAGGAADPARPVGLDERLRRRSGKPLRRSKQAASQGRLYAVGIVRRQSADPSQNQGGIQCEKLQADPAGHRQAGVRPGLNRDVAGPGLPGRRRDHRQDQVTMRLIERCRRHDERRPAFAGLPVAEREGHGDDVERLKGHATPRRLQGSTTRS